MATSKVPPSQIEVNLEKWLQEGKFSEFEKEIYLDIIDYLGGTEGIATVGDLIASLDDQTDEFKELADLFIAEYNDPAAFFSINKGQINEFLSKQKIDAKAASELYDGEWDENDPLILDKGNRLSIMRYVIISAFNILHSDFIQVFLNQAAL